MAQEKQPLIMILDGQGGGVGKNIAEHLLAEKLPVQLIVVGTNAIATSNMMKPGVPLGATGENACLYNCRKADVIIGPIGIIFPNAMNGEITPKMAEAVAESPGRRVLVPVANNHVHIVGLAEKNLGQYIEEAVQLVAGFYKE